jgi:hypothetical protein
MEVLRGLAKGAPYIGGARGDYEYLAAPASRKTDDRGVPHATKNTAGAMYTTYAMHSHIAPAVAIPQTCSTPTTCVVPSNPWHKPLFPPTYVMNESTIVVPPPHSRPWFRVHGLDRSRLRAPFPLKLAQTHDSGWGVQVMPCNSSGWSDPVFFGSFGIVDFDWSNAGSEWRKAKPMDCQQRLITQAKMTKATNPKVKTWVYRYIAIYLIVDPGSMSSV